MHWVWNLLKCVSVCNPVLKPDIVDCGYCSASVRAWYVRCGHKASARRVCCTWHNPCGLDNGNIFILL